MRTQLLHMVLVADADAESDRGGAANDEGQGPAAVAVRPILTAVAATEGLAPQIGAVRAAREVNDDCCLDDYWLGGYAGI